ncbi:MAG TPA: hypothetical protein VFI48_11470 [Hyphomicrobiaceae bacterium]|nr:hypothetical protein [Hyphomicrobiaceae bacterium]
MTYEQFLATRKWSENLLIDCEPYAANNSEQSDYVQSGYIYCDSLFIEATEAWWPEGARDQGKWHLLLERDEYITDDLDMLQRRLYRWAISAGYGDESDEGAKQIGAWQDEAYEIAAKWATKIGGGFHPDTRGKDYVLFATSERMFSDAEAADYDGDMDRLFALAADPYETALCAMRDVEEGER